MPGAHSFFALTWVSFASYISCVPRIAQAHGLFCLIHSSLLPYTWVSFARYRSLLPYTWVSFDGSRASWPHLPMSPCTSVFKRTPFFFFCKNPVLLPRILFFWTIFSVHCKTISRHCLLPKLSATPLNLFYTKSVLLPKTRLHYTEGARCGGGRVCRGVGWGWG